MRQNLALFENEDVIYKKYLPQITTLQNKPIKINEWDIPYTISELSYLVHSDYRYYGKFPSAVAGQILEQILPPSPDHYVLDNFCGSGTTLIEAKLRGIKSYGVDISWLSVLASNVKARYIDTADVKKELFKLVTWFENNKENFSSPEDAFVNKWFSPQASRDLCAIQDYILTMNSGAIRDFMLVAFIGIIRRVSKAHDAEVRPHINKNKKERDVISAFSKKISDMSADHAEFNLQTDKNLIADCFIADNTNLPKLLDDKKCYLVISHPPYLNSFNYAPVYSLEFYWGSPFEAEYTEEKKNFYKEEMKAHPANEKITEEYFNHLDKCYRETYRIQPNGSTLAIVIGDCTRNGKLIPVIDQTIEIVENIGYRLEEVNYRTTHYGLGKYAYKHRADYHGTDNEKKDGILIFKK
ncbi:MAG: hypothetical protein GW903_00160 [Alphaproteobacteria bacterium]|nr:hypothetical protein [Alphaproteobacteria bacterium]NCQ87383.1 hypothetical protein [Alphaproteobacteria bacterium]NCT06254.1 hypothetical protein [Alphaproteobacteria bacterium]